MSESNEEMKGNETKQDEPKREKVRVVDISLIKDFPGHPFLVKDDESMAQLVKSIEMNGVLNPVIARKIGEDQYELISGHRRKHACILLGIKKIPLIGREMSKEEAVIEMVDSNLQREHILPSEKARAYGNFAAANGRYHSESSCFVPSAAEGEPRRTMKQVNTEITG